MATLKAESPFAVVLHLENVFVACSYCFAFGKTVKKCKGCHFLSYCTETCQKSDWKNHKKECGLLKKALASKRFPGDHLRLVSRILLKSKDALTVKSFNGRTWDSVVDRSADFKEEKMKEFNEGVDAIINFLKPVKKVSREEVAKTLGKTVTNAIGIIESKESYKEIGLGIYLGFTAHKHSCLPDAQLIFNGTKACMKAFDPTATYSTDLTCSITHCVPCYPNRKKEFINEHFFECDCELCSDSNHIIDRMGHSCYVSCCEDGAGILDENSNGPYRCNKCGEASQIAVEDVESAESLISNHFDIVFNFHDEEMLVKTKDVMDATEKILSVYNFQFVHLCSSVALIELGKRNYETCKYALDMNITAFEYYLRDMDKRRTAFVMKRMRDMKEFFETEDTSDVIPVLNAGIRTYGEDHPVIVDFKKFMVHLEVREASRPLRESLRRRLEEMGVNLHEVQLRRHEREHHQQHEHHHCPCPHHHNH